MGFSELYEQAKQAVCSLLGYGSPRGRRKSGRYRPSEKIDGSILYINKRRLPEGGREYTMGGSCSRYSTIEDFAKAVAERCKTEPICGLDTRRGAFGISDYTGRELGEIQVECEIGAGRRLILSRGLERQAENSTSARTPPRLKAVSARNRG